MTVPAVQVRGECSYGTCRSSQQARLGPLPSLSSSAVVLRKGGDLALGETFRFSVKIHSGIEPDPSLQPRGLKYWLCELFLALGGLPHRQLWSVSVGMGSVVGVLRLMQTP